MGRMKELALEQEEWEIEMSGAHLTPEEMAFEDENVAVKVEGLTNWLSNLHVIGEEDAFLRVKDLETGKTYLVKELKEDAE